jgi:hypothetical protein
MQFSIYMRKWSLLNILVLALVAAPSAFAAMECKTPKGQKCVCAARSPKKCAHTAKAVCLSGEMIEPEGHLNTAHENNVTLFRQCAERGGIKEIVFNRPILDTLHFIAPPTATAATGD